MRSLKFKAKRKRQNHHTYNKGTYKQLYSGPSYNLKLKSSLVKQLKSQTVFQIKEYLAQSQSLKKQHTKLNLDLELDSWQKEALQTLMDGYNLVVDAPTTAGKTRIIEIFFYHNLNIPHFRAAYTSPIKSLSNDKFKEFKTKFGEQNVGLATGDIKIQLNAPIVVATLECYRNSLLGTEIDLKRTIVIFDEYHYLQDYERGSAWEEAIILTPQDCQIVLLSASVSNGDEFTEWIKNIKQKPAKLIRTNYRPVPLVNLVNINNTWILESLIKDQLNKFKNQNKKLLYKKLSNITHINYDIILNKLQDIIDLNLTPCVLYVAKRLSCELVAKKLCNYIAPLNSKQRSYMCKLLSTLNEEYNYSSFISSELKEMIETYGIAYHHSGLTAPVRMCIESLLKRGELRFCIATMGLSLGIDFSVKSSLIVEHKRPDERGFMFYSPTEVLQMLGRAGRRGKDIVGFSLWPSIELYSLLANPKRERCDSCLKNDPTTFLGLIRKGFDINEIETFYSKSFKKFTNPKKHFTLIDLHILKKFLKVNDLPCVSPIYEFESYFNHSGISLCVQCKFRKQCHRVLKTVINHSELAQIHFHLHQIKTLDSKDNLTTFGDIACHFPQVGGLVIAKLIHDKYFTHQNLIECAEIMASFCIPRFKIINTDDEYELPLGQNYIETLLEYFYPYELFSELYEKSKRHKIKIFRDFNPNAGFVLKSWIKNITNWNTLETITTSESFSAGDLMSLLYRTAVYLNSLAQAKNLKLSKYAALLRKEILRPPLSTLLLQ